MYKTVLHSKMKEFADESVSVFTVLLHVYICQRGNSPFMLNSRTFRGVEHQKQNQA